MSSKDLNDVTWDKKALPDTMSRGHLEGVNTAMLVLTSLIFVARVVARFTHRMPFELHDFFCWFSYVCYVAMVVMFFKENSPLYRAEAVQRGEIPIYPELLHDAGMLFRWLTAGQILFYSSLLFVKLSLLTLYRRLLNRTPPKFTIMWWAILIFCVLAFIGSSMTTIFVCDDHKAKYNQGLCAKPQEQNRGRFSLWFAYAVDVVADLAVMFLPFRMTWNLQMPKTEKIGVFALFGSGWICILFATLRAVQVTVEDGVPKVPDPKWLQMWTVIETSMAVIIGCAPAFASMIRRRFGTPDVSYDSRGYIRRPTVGSKTKSLGSDSTEGKRRNDDLILTDRHGSEDAIMLEDSQATVTTIPMTRRNDPLEKLNERAKG
ncbi:hypothetical protein P154DRAFT_519182 [Amniculicola lignicola CBS 123094]|uniref:Rhodopsin domain-containing protein n=1 Tax=Amniculicola lignicola CBS 123094 TaxID=1392246 RepID=A0A6A5X209_9PLEO|nr:hypothetical protein P154DRAFT_519182 [Amniculicola lignicola CBS 123094]